MSDDTPVEREFPSFSLAGSQEKVRARILRIGARRLLVAVALLGLAGLALWWIFGRSAAAPGASAEKGPPARNVRVVEATRGALPDVVAVTGTLAAEEQVVLGAKVAGRLADIPVDLGSRVAKGQVLARLAPADFQLRVRQAEAALDQARSRLGLPPGGPDTEVDPEQTGVVRQAQAALTEARARRDRAQALFEEQVLPRAELDTAEAALQTADSQYQNAQEEVLNRQALLAQRRSELGLAGQELADSVLVAPFSGAVSERQGSPGQFVAAGDPIVTVVRVHPLRLRLAIPERAAAKIRPGQDVRVRVDGDPRTYTGRVARVSPAIQESNRTLQIEAEVPNPDGALRPGSFASAEIVSSLPEPVILVPASSIVSFAGIEKVLVVEKGKAVEKRVRSGRKVNDQVEIVEGIVAGEAVVLEPGNLVGGQPVTVVS